MTGANIIYLTAKKSANNTFAPYHLLVWPHPKIAPVLNQMNGSAVQRIGTFVFEKISNAQILTCKKDVIKKVKMVSFTTFFVSLSQK